MLAEMFIFDSCLFTIRYVVKKMYVDIQAKKVNKTRQKGKQTVFVH